MPDDDHQKLIDAMAKLQGHRAVLNGAAKKVHERATQQLDTMPEAIETSEAYQKAGKGGVAVHRMTRTLHRERHRLGLLVEDSRID